jgi:RNA polymerase sigma-70 factor (ECF subfamily)
MKRHIFDAAVSRYSRRVFTYSCYLLGDRVDAEDVTQEVLIKLWDRGPEIEADRLGAWLLTVTRNACTDAIRKRRRAAEIVPIRRDGEIAADRPSSSPNPEQLAAGSQLGDRIFEALDLLTEPSRSVVILREIQGLSYAEIAEVTGISLDSVKVTLHRARRRLRESLKEVRPHVAAG